MATIAPFAGTTDGMVYCSNATYLTARSGGGTLAVTNGGTSQCGQELFSGTTYYVYELFFEYDTSSLGAGAVVSSAILTFYHGSFPAGLVGRARLYDWGGGTLTTADFVPGASLSSYTLLAHIASAGVTTGQYNNWVDDAFAANVNKTGMTRIVLCTDTIEDATAPVGVKYFGVHMADFAGTTVDPYLTVTYTPADAIPYRNSMPQLIAQFRAIRPRVIDGLWRPDRRLVTA